MTGAPKSKCPICGGADLHPGLVCKAVPVHSVVLHQSRESALAAARGDLVLAACEACGFVFNTAYDPGLQNYGIDYESTQAFSETFNAFHASLAAEVAAAAGLDGAPVVEIGCGQGEFLALLKQQGCRNLIGVDPAYDATRSIAASLGDIAFVPAAFSGASVTGAARAIVCKMTLEHIADPVAMLRQMAELAARSNHCAIFVQVPNAQSIFNLSAFWDVYYEHCNYFTARTLDQAMRRGGLTVKSISPLFADQYLAAKATRSRTSNEADFAPNARAELASFDQFCRSALTHINVWRDRIRAWGEAGERIMLWGGGSKAVAFVAFTGAEQSLAAAVDVNPRKSDTFLPASALPVLSPAQAKEAKPTVIILMNPVYRAEVERECSRLGIEAKIVGLHDASRANAA